MTHADLAKFKEVYKQMESQSPVMKTAAPPVRSSPNMELG
jgi:hypothetical protein